jgi:hypothetical protein
MQDYIEDSEPMGEPERKQAEVQHLCYAELCWELSRNVRYNEEELLRSLLPPLGLPL